MSDEKDNAKVDDAVAADDVKLEVSPEVAATFDPAVIEKMQTPAKVSNKELLAIGQRIDELKKSLPNLQADAIAARESADAVITQARADFATADQQLQDAAVEVARLEEQVWQEEAERLKGLKA